MEPKNTIEKAIEQAGGNIDRVRIKMICPRFSDKEQLYKIRYDANHHSIYIMDPKGTDLSYRYPLYDFEQMNVAQERIIVLTEEEVRMEYAAEEALKKKMEALKSFSFEKFLGQASIEDVILMYMNTQWNLKGANAYFNVKMKKGSSGLVVMNNGEHVVQMNLREIEDLVKSGVADVKMKK